MIGIDEAGRGSAVGSMFVVGVKFVKSLPEELKREIKDSKKLSKRKRERLAKEIYKYSDIKICKCDCDTIDKIGLSDCYVQCLKLIKQHFGEDIYIFDGNTNYGIEGIETLVKGDSKILEISAASIIAKYSKDKEMEMLDKKYPEYGWIKNSGYLTKSHKEAIKKYGLAEYHRESWKITI